MKDLQTIGAALAAEQLPEGGDAKAFKKCVKAWKESDSPRIVPLHPLRAFHHDDVVYTVYAFSPAGNSIDEATLPQLTAEAKAMDIGELRYDSVQSNGRNYWQFKGDEFTHEMAPDERDSVTEWSDAHPGIVIYTKSEVSVMTSVEKLVRLLDCRCAILGPRTGVEGNWVVQPVPQCAIAEPASGLKFEGLDAEVTPSTPADARREAYTKAMTYLGYAILAAGLIYWYFIR